MKWIAHRGACLECQEDTLASLERGAAYGAYAVECDPRQTADGVWVLFHDEDLSRLAGDPAKVSELTYEEMKAKLAAAGKALTKLDEVLTSYHGASAVLFDLPENMVDEAFYRRLAAAPFPAIAGVHAPEEARIARRFFAQDAVLAFMPKAEQAAEFAEAGAGLIRLWENWLGETSIAAVRKEIPADREIVIMSVDFSVNHPLHCMNSSPEQINRLIADGADGVLFNDIALIRSGKLPLATDRLLLRPWRADDAAALYEYASDPATGPAAGWPPHKSEAESREIIEKVLSVPETYAMVRKGEMRPIGCASIKTGGTTDLTDRADEGELGFWLGEPFRGQGYMTEAVCELERHAFCDLGFRALWCGYYEGNERSRRVQEKTGFRYHHTVENAPVPLLGTTRTCLYSRLTKEDWEKQRREVNNRK